MLLASIGLACILAPVQDADKGDINAGTKSQIELKAPEFEESLSFVLFGDRTTGPRSGVDVLREAVRMTNRLDPDFVMTVGDMIEGSRDPKRWRAQMKEYRGVVEELNMPWFPCAGNHDVYGNAENLELYKEHFGPLYYSFDCRWVHFVVLFTDEGMSRHDQDMSEEQMTWLKEDLAQTKAEQVLVFFHQPRWHYHNSNWPLVHDILKNDGRVVALFAGHWHTWRDDGEHDGMHHYVVAGTGGGLGPLRQSAQIQEVCHVRVRRSGISLAVMPVGQVHGGDMVLGSEVDAMNGLQKGGWSEVESQILRSPEGPVDSSFRVTIRNPTEHRLRWDVGFQTGPGWSLRAEKEGGELEPEGEVSFRVIARAPRFDGRAPDAFVMSTLHYPLKSGLVQPITSRIRVPHGIKGGDKLAQKRGPNLALKLDGRSCVRIPWRERLAALTLECWVRGEPPKGWSGLVSKTQQSGFSLNWADPQPDGNVRIRGHRNYVNVKTAEPWEWSEWTHLAFSWDGKIARIFRNGKLEGEKPADGILHDNSLPLFIGADTNGRGNPDHHFRGEIDEVRVSSRARYRKNFRPRKRFKKDEDTVLLLHFDRSVEGVFVDASGHDNHGWPLGNPQLVEADR